MLILFPHMHQAVKNAYVCFILLLSLIEEIFINLEKCGYAL